MIDNPARLLAEMLDGTHKMTGTPQGDLINVAEHAVRRAGLPKATVSEALRYLQTEGRDRL